MNDKIAGDAKQSSVQEAAKFLHNIGAIIHAKFAFGIPDLVILDPAWLFDALSSFFEVARYLSSPYHLPRQISFPLCLC